MTTTNLMLIFSHTRGSKLRREDLSYVVEGLHMRLRARDQYTSNTLIGGKGGAGPSSLHTTLEGTNGVCEC